MDGVPYPQPLTGHEPQYVPWGVLLVRPIGHPPRAGATSGRWPTVPGVTHLIARAQMGPIRTPGGPPNPRGRVPHQRYSRALVIPAPPPLVPASQLSSPGASPCPAPLAVPPGSRHVPSAPAVCPCSGVLVSLVVRFVFFFLFPPPMSPRCLLTVLALFVGGRRRRGGGGGAFSLSALLRKHVGSTAQARGTALVPPLGGGGCRVAPVVTLPCLRLHPRRSPRWGLHGACSPWARSCGSFRTLVPLPPQPAAVSSGGGVRRPLPSSLLPPRLLPVALASFLGGCGRWGPGGGGRPRCPSSGVSTSQARHWHVARHSSFCWGVGHAAWSPSSPCPLCVRSPGAPPAGACSALASLGRGRAVRPAPSPRCPPFVPLCPREGGPLSAPPFLHPPPLGGRRHVGGGGGLVVFPPLLSRHRHEARLPSLCRGGGLPRGSLRHPFYPTPAPPVVPPPGLARRAPCTGTVVWLVPHPPTSASPPCRVALGGGGAFRPLPTRFPRPRGGGGVGGGEGRPFRLPSVARTSQA